MEDGYSSSKRKGGEEGVVTKKRVMVVIDRSTGAKEAMLWALTHVVNRGDQLTLLHAVQSVQKPDSAGDHKCCSSSGGDGGGREEQYEAATHLATSLASLCKACKQEVAVEALVLQGSKLVTVLNQVKKLEVSVLVLSVLVLSQCKPKPLTCLFRSSNEAFVEECISTAECLAMAVRRRSKGVGGYLVTTKLQKNFWLLA